MRSALTLIELIFTMVIVGLVFTVVPKIVFVTNKSFETVSREDALYNAVSMAGIVASLPWDENNTIYSDVLGTDSTRPAYLCDATTGFYRIGGFKGGRNCMEASAAAKASPIGREDSLHNDLDDYDGYSVTTATPGGSKYLLSVKVRYLADPPPGGVVDFSTLPAVSTSSNIKEVNVTVTNAAGRVKSPFVSSVYYESVNIGQTAVKRRAWR